VHRQVVAGDDAAVLIDPLGIDAAQALGEHGREHEPDGDRLPVAEVVVTGGLQGMAQGVAVVQHRTATALALVTRNHVGLDGDAPGDALVQVAVDQRFAAQEVVLGHLAQPAPVLAGRQRLEHLGVAQHCRRLPEGAHQILPLGQIDAGLPADGGVDLAQQGGRHRNPPNAPVIHGRREAGGVCDHPPADGDHDVAPRQAPAGELPAQVLDGLQVLRPLAVAHEERSLLDAGVDRDSDALLGDDRRPSRSYRQDLEQTMAGATAHEHVVGPLP